MPVGASVHASIRRIPFSEMDDFSTLFRDYCTGFDALSSFYAGDYRAPAARRAAVERAAAHERDRDTLADVLLEQNERWGLPQGVRDHIEALRRSGSAAVVTGQQVGLLTGPLYTILKTVSTIQLAEQLSAETGRDVVPVFWLGGEDHDFEEISKVSMLRRNEPVEVRYVVSDAGSGGNVGPVGRIELNEEVERIVGELEDVLPPTDFRDEVMQVVRTSYRSGTTFSDAFARMLRALFPNAGLVIIDSDDVRLKRLAAPLYKKEIDDAEHVAELVRKTSATLADSYHSQVHVRPSNLFLINERGRFPLDLDDGVFRLRDQDERYTRAELHELLDEAPDRFSPNVVLRPLTQDLLLPTALYVAGPSEIAYFAQYGDVYDWAGIPMPLVYPRASVSIVESKVSKVLEKYGLTVGDVGEDLDRLFQRVVVDAMDVDVDEVFSDAGRHLHEAVNAVKGPLEEIDRTLSGAAEATRKAFMEEFDKLKAKAVRLEKKNHDVVRDQLEKAQSNLYPAGVLQERAISILYFVNKYSLDLIGALLGNVSTDTTEHQIVEL
ncbi:MAG: bacillithiol biosynthesis cysteine-adding enzyme BshC [Rhodothermales bacterium]